MLELNTSRTALVVIGLQEGILPFALKQPVDVQAAREIIPMSSLKYVIRVNECSQPPYNFKDDG